MDNFDLENNNIEKTENTSSDENVNPTQNDFPSNDKTEDKTKESEIDMEQVNAVQNETIQNDAVQDRNAAASDSLKTSTFYTESYKRPAEKKNNFFQYILIGLICSVFGGMVVGVFLTFVAPIINPAINDLLGKTVAVKNDNAQNLTSDSYKKVVIEKSDTPITAIAQKVSPSIVGIKTTFKAQDFFLGTQQGGGEGSGITIRSDGYILTNNHVIQDAIDSSTGKISSSAKIEVILPGNIDKPYTAEIIGRDEQTDLAVLKINATNLTAAEIGNSDNLKVGELAVAIGCPGGLAYMGSVTAGVISGLDRTVSEETGNELKMIQTDASINPGNSGGALLNSEGKVIGINSLKAKTELGFEGLGFAIPINKAMEISNSLIESGYIKRPFLGIGSNPDYNADIAKQNKLPEGVLVDSVQPLSGAYTAGIQRGDIITKFEGEVIKSLPELNKAKNKHKPGDTVNIEVYRQGKTVKLQANLTEQK